MDSVNGSAATAQTQALVQQTQQAAPPPPPPPQEATPAPAPEGNKGHNLDTYA